MKVNGAAVKAELVNGYCAIAREWKAGDTVEVVMNMPVRRIKAHDKVEADKGRLAVERGPIVYCAEGADNGGNVLNKAIAADAAFTQTECNILGNVYPALAVEAKAVRKSMEGKVQVEPCELKLIPYFAWCHRGAGELQTWFPTETKE